MYKQINVVTFVLFFILGLFSFVLAADETLTITTYYPSPYGNYTNLTVTGNTYLATTTGTNVGIGTSSPGAILHVNQPTGLGTGIGSQTILGRFQQSNSNANYLDIKHRRHTAGSAWDTTNVRIQRMIDVTNQGFIDFGIDTVSADYGLGFGSGSTTLMVLTASGYLGVGVTSPSANLHVNGRIRSNSWTADGSVVAYKSAAGDLGVASSDRRLKKNITPVTNALDIVKKLSGIKYNNINEKDNDQKKLGLIAQDVMKVVPEAAFSYKNDKGQTYYGVHYDKVPVILIEAIKEQQKEIDDLRAEIAKLQKTQCKCK